MRLIQITDLHHGLPGEKTRDIDVRRQLVNIITAIQAIPCDAYILTGDFCYMEPQTDIYLELRSLLNNLPQPYFLIPGNHDDPRMMFKVWNNPGQNKVHYYSFSWPSLTCLFLDTSPGSISPRQYRWLEEQLNQLISPVIIFSHHPLSTCGVPYMDVRYALAGQQKIMALLQRCGKDVHVFCGHYHVDKTVSSNRITHYLTPSVFVQFHPESKDGVVFHSRPGYRIIEVEEGIVSTYTVYQDTMMLP